MLILNFPPFIQELLMRFFCEKLSKKFNLGINFLFHILERIDPGNDLNRLETTTKIVSGYSRNCTKLSKNFLNLF